MEEREADRVVIVNSCHAFPGIKRSIPINRSGMATISGTNCRVRIKGFPL